MKSPRSTSLAAVLTAALFASACGGSTSDAPAEGADATPAAGSDSAAETNPLVGEFASIDGETIDLADYTGQDTLFWFWEPW